MATRPVTPHFTDEEIAEHIERNLEWDGRTFRQGQYVGILDGKVVLVADTPEEALAAFRAIEPDPSKGLLCVAAPPVPDIIR